MILDADPAPRTVRWYYLYAGKSELTYQLGSRNYDKIVEKQEDLESQGYDTYIDYEDMDE